MNRLISNKAFSVRMKHSALVLLLGVGIFLLAAWTPSYAQDNNKEKTAANSLTIKEMISYGQASTEEVEAVINSMLTEQGKFVMLPKQRKVLVTDRAETVVEIMEIIRQLNQPTPNVRIDLMFAENSSSNTSGVTYEWKGKTGGVTAQGGGLPEPAGNRVRIGKQDGTHITIDGINRTTTTTRNAGQFLIVRSGGYSTIAMVKEVPQPQYFYNYIINNQLFTVPADIRWRNVGTQMKIKPTVVENMITVEIVPELSVLVDDPNSAALTGVPQTIELKTLSTTVTLANGASVNIGGFSNAGSDFNRSFFGGGRKTTTDGGGSFTLRASIQ